MVRVNPHYATLRSSYLFAEIASRVRTYESAHPDRDVIKLGIGDYTHGLAPGVVEAIVEAAREMGSDAGFRGYGPEQGYPFLREAIATHDYAERGVTIDADEVFVSDGAKSDTSALQELFAGDVRVGVPDPVYPVYVDSNVMAGRGGADDGERYTGIHYLDGTAKNGFRPAIPTGGPSVVYLCFPNNPTGVVADRSYLAEWVAWAHRTGGLILFDAAYEAFVRDDSVPRSIYEVEGAHEVAVEFRSFSKTAGFTGMRCAFTVVPKACRAYSADHASVPLHPMWLRRQTTRFNGVAYPVQRAAAAVYSEPARTQTRERIAYYLKNAARLRAFAEEKGFETYGGVHAPYVWVRVGGDDRDWFARILEHTGVVVTPGSGFGRNGKGFIRLSAFNSHEAVESAVGRLSAFFDGDSVATDR